MGMDIFRRERAILEELVWYWSKCGDTNITLVRYAGSWVLLNVSDNLIKICYSFITSYEYIK